MMKNLFYVILLALLTTNAFSQNENIRIENRKNKGYFNTTQVSLLMGRDPLNEQSNYYFNYIKEQFKIHTLPSVTITNGYMFNEQWSAGIGIGFEMFDQNLFPLFADIRYTLRDNEIAPFFAIKTGYSIGHLKKKHYDEFYFYYQPYYVTDVYFKNHGGFMFHPEIGTKIPLSEKADLLLTIAYRYQVKKTSVTKENTKWEHIEDLYKLSFGVAIMFR